MSRPVTPSPSAPESDFPGAPSFAPSAKGGSVSPPSPAFHDPKHHIKIFHGDCLQILAALPAESIDLIFADPPYFLSNGGITCHAGRMVSVNKGEWDRLPGPDRGPVRARYDKVHEFNTAWLAACQRVLKPDASIWISGTSHVIHSVGFALQQLGFKLLNDISWVKPNPPPNLSCRYFTHATETIIWAARDKKSRHKFNYQLMRQVAGGKQMKSVWTIPPPEPWEKNFGKHPAQKPLALLKRILLASSDEGDLLLDPFLGSGTSALAALRAHRRIIGCEMSLESVSLSLTRLCSDLVHAQISLDCIHFSIDRLNDPVDRSIDRPNGRSNTRPIATKMSPAPNVKLVRRERRYYFIGSSRREVIYSAPADSLEDAWAKFTSSSESSAQIIFIIKTETEIYLNDGT
ncbi:MAG TPA: DNA methyltransferase [Candidatus Acidoferrales bacterium]|nr:DNA methyltransferase [Candidatus Acidoferrales bacterium]